VLFARGAGQGEPSAGHILAEKDAALKQGSGSPKGVAAACPVCRVCEAVASESGFPKAIPEIPVSNVEKAAEYHVNAPVPFRLG